MLLFFRFGGVINLIGKFGKKKNVCDWTCTCRTDAIIRLLDARSIPLLIVSVLIAGIGAALQHLLIMEYRQISPDYIEVSMGIRAEGAVHLFPALSQCAMGIGGAIPGICYD